MDTGSQKENASEVESSKKHDSETDKDFINQTLQKERMIDPGNEHTHLSNENEFEKKDTEPMDNGSK